ncbi:pilus assembly protein TadE [Duganella sp. FT80W]|uniref:Pilus assembly protein TadE n=1 Tax=Duganella guangzhouensis TaxID=2666084 RepID=A0A6I2L4G9_9BURK|nr:pilus assembly protein TadG-related protein [Duganella guangzhouensis]MRW91506.1 pilus assembly protein TadE [Duganella guangzhouensis]
MSLHPSYRYPSGAPRGAVALVFALMLFILLGFIAMALDLGCLYNRQAELRAVANTAALAAARQLNGSAAGVVNALAQAASAVAGARYQYRQQTISWSGAALSFSSASDGVWVDAASAQAAPEALFFVRVDTGALASDPGTVDGLFMRVLSAALASASVRAVAVAGRSTIDVAPLALCALSATPATARANPGPPANTELVEYGFRRGVAYDLMQLNPDGTTAENFVVDPFTPPGATGAAGNTAVSLVGPYVCTGQLAMPRVTGGALTVARPFPLASLYNQLNARFDQYSGALCSFVTAPPDTNIKSYVYSSAAPWMTVTPAAQGAQSSTSGGKLWTVADPLPAPTGNTAAMYGPLWAYARAVPYSSYVAGAAEPSAGYTPFATGDWATLYAPGLPVAKTTYPSGTLTPYKTSSGSFFLAPSSAHKGVAGRRVLNVPLLACPVSGGSATVLAVGKFLMTVPATASALYAEFGGVAAPATLGGGVELYR